jgi:NADH-quinone oxidoreductase subunit J
VSPLLFVVLAFLTVVAALTVVLHRNPVHSACALVVTLFLLAVFFVGLDAQLVAALQVIVYAGAIVVLFLFVIMLLNLQVEVRDRSAGAVIATGAVGSVTLAVLVVAALLRTGSGAAKGVTEGYGETVALAERLFTVYLVPFELTSILLLVAIVGAVALAKKGG